MDQIRTLRMIRQLDGPLPDITIPPHYVIRRFQPGDELVWGATLHENGDLGDWDEERVYEAFEIQQKNDIGRVWKDSIHFAYDAEGHRDERSRLPVGTACVQRHDDHPHMPELGWVSVSPRHRRLGLGRALATSVLHFMKSHGYTCCILRTNTARLDAVRTFLSIGFTPYEDHLTYDRRRWNRIFDEIGWKRR